MLKYLMMSLALCGCYGRTELIAEQQAETEGCYMPTSFPREYLNRTRGITTPVVGSIPVRVGEMASVEVPKDARFVFATVGAPGFDLTEADAHIEQSIPLHGTAIYPAVAAWVPIQPNTQLMLMSNDGNVDMYFTIAFSTGNR